MAELEYNSLLRLKDALEGAQKNTNRMLSRLEKFENRLGDLDEKMRPIQVTTGRYLKAKNNISETLLEVGKTYDYFRVANDVRETITRGYVANNQKEFLEAFKKLSQAKIFFQEHKEIKSAQSVLSSIESLLQSATIACSQEFEKLLQQSGKSVECLAPNHFEPVNPFSPEVAKDMKMLCDTFELSKYNAYYTQFQASRIQRVRGDLKELETSQGALWNSLQGEDPYQRNNLPFAETVALVTSLLRSEYQLWTNLLPMNEESMAVFIAICDAAVGELQRLFAPLLSDKASKSLPGSTQVIRQSKMLLVRLDLFDAFSLRYDELRDICHPDARHESSASLALKTMRSMIVEAGVRCIAFLTSTSIADGFTMVKKSLVGGLVSGNHSANSQDDGIDNLACDLHPVTGNLLFLSKELLLSGTSYTVLYRRMVDVAHAPGGASVVAQQYDTLLSAYPEADEAVMALLDNLFTALEARADKFDNHLKSKAAGRRALAVNHHALYDFEDKFAEECVMFARKHLFLINNLYAVLSFAKDRKRDLQGGGTANNASNNPGNAAMNAATTPKPPASLTIRSTPGNQGNNANSTSSSSSNNSSSSTANKNARINRLNAFIDRIEARLRTEQEMFCETIASALGLGAQDMLEFQHAYDKDKANQNRLLKAKFSIFNTGMDAFLAQQGEWRVSSASLRDVLAQQLTQRVLATYTTFFATYSAVKFSKKHMNEYLKYTPAQLELHLRSFFGRAT